METYQTNLKRILLVEDDKDDQYFFIEALSKMEDAALFDLASNGQEAIDKLKASTVLPDFIFMDINMPVMNGIDCLKEIRSIPLFDNIVVIIVSSAIELAALVRKCQGQGFVKKVADLETLRKSIEEMLHLDFSCNRGMEMQFVFSS